MQSSQPLVSCLCLTEGRVHYLDRSIKCFQRQLYPNKEMVIVYNSNDQLTVNYLASQINPNIKSFPLPYNSEFSLGEKRNFSIEKSTGSLLCQWDDDDWYHPERLSKQVEAILQSGKEACALTNIVFCDHINENSYFSYYRYWENSIMFKTQIFLDTEIKYPSINREEDTYFVQELLLNNLIFPLTYPPLYLYNIHGNNTWKQDHFENLFNKSQLLSELTHRKLIEIQMDSQNTSESGDVLRDKDILSGLFYHMIKNNS